MVLLLLSFLVFVLLLLWYVTGSRCKNRRGGIPRSNGLPILGHLMDAVLHPNTFHLKLESMKLSIGPVYEIYAINQRIVVIGEAATARQVLTHRPSTFRRIGSLQPMAEEIGITGVFSAEGDDWKRQRKLTSPAFTPTQVRNHYSAIGLVCKRLRNKWKKQISEQENPKNGAVIDVLTDLMSFTLDIISAIAFGYDLNSLEQHSDIVDYLLLYMPIVHKRIILPIPYWRYFSLAIDRKFDKGQKRVRELVDEMIREYYSQPVGQRDAKSHKSFIQTILNARETSEDQLNDNEILGNVVTLLLAGQDTTANSLSWSLYYLSRNQDIQEDLFEEVSNQEKSEEFPFLPAKHQIEKLTLCNGVIKESLRLRGPSPLMYLESNVDTSLTANDKEFAVRKGDILTLLNRSILTDDKNYRKAKTFFPKRWENEEETANTFLANLPFGGGPRICPGKNLSMMESCMLLSTVCNEFIIRPPNGSIEKDPSIYRTEDPSIKETLAFTMSPYRLHLRFFERA